MSEPTLSSPVTLLDRTLWLGEIRLHDDDITISGWTWTGPFRKQIPISEITIFETWAGESTGTNYFRLRANGDVSVRGQMKAGSGSGRCRWKTTSGLT